MALKLCLALLGLLMLVGCTARPFEACYWGSVNPVGPRYCNDPGER